MSKFIEITLQSYHHTVMGTFMTTAEDDTHSNILIVDCLISQKPIHDTPSDLLEPASAISDECHQDCLEADDAAGQRHSKFQVLRRVLTKLNE